MFDVGWSELLVIAIVIIVVIGPKDLPAMLRSFGKMLAKLRALSTDFRTQFDDAMNAQNLKQDLDALRAELHNLKKVNPLTEARDQLEREVRTLEKLQDKNLEGQDKKKSDLSSSPPQVKSDPQQGDAISGEIEKSQEVSVPSSSSSEPGKHSSEALSNSIVSERGV